MTNDAYRKMVQDAWRDQKLMAEELVSLVQWQLQLAITPESAAAIERDVMGMTKEEASIQRFQAGGLGPGVDAAANTISNDMTRSVDSFEGHSKDVSGGGVLPKTMGRGRYHVIEILGVGGMGQVLKVFDSRLGEMRAVKILSRGREGGGEWRDRMKREVRISQKLRHPGIVQVFDYECDEDAGCDFISMEFVQGKTLRSWIGSFRSERIPLTQILLVAVKLLEAIEHAHAQGVVHLDLKPENVIVSQDLHQVRILDFGIARALDSIEFQGGLKAEGTPSYMAPEQERGGVQVGCPADVFSMGCMLYEMLVGRLPRGVAPAPHAVRSDVGHALSDAVMSALNVDQAMRPSIGALRECVFASGGPISAKMVDGEGRGSSDANSALADFEKTYWSTRPADRGALLARSAASQIQAWRAAALESQTFAEYLMGCCAIAGISMKQDKKAAVEWLRRCAEKEHAAAMHDMGCAYLHGEGVDRDPVKACKWLLMAAERGHSHAQYEIGYAFQKGAGVQQDVGEAIRWYRNAADQGECRAQYCLACALYDGEGVVLNRFEAFRWWQQSALADHGESMLRVALCYQEGHGVEKNPGEAIAWFRKASALGLAEAQVRLAWAYWNGGHGVSQDFQRAREWFEKAAFQGNAEAQWEFGRFDLWESEQSKHWLNKAAEQGHAEAQRKLGAREPVVPQKSVDELLTWVVGFPLLGVVLWGAYHVGSWILSLLGWLVGVLF